MRYVPDGYSLLVGEVFDGPVKNVNENVNSDCIEAASVLLLGFPRPQTAARIPISWKRGFEVLKPPFPLVLVIGVFFQKHLLFSTREHIENGDLFDRKLLFPASVKATGNGGFGAPKPLFSRKWGVGPLSGVGGMQVFCYLMCCSGRSIPLETKKMTDQR